MISLESMQKAIVEENLDGWLFFHFRGRDPVTMRILGLSITAISTRPAYYLVPAVGRPVKIVHTIEQTVFDELPGERIVYATRTELLEALSAQPKGRVAVQFSQELPIVSYLDLGTARTLESLGFTLESSGSLIQRTVGVLDEAGIASHERASTHLLEIVDNTWNRVRELFEEGRTATEGEIQAWITDEFAARGLYTDHPPIVACGPHAGDPHYEPPADGGAVLKAGEVLQLDLWAKEQEPGAIYGDISWLGCLAEGPNPEVQKAFEVLIRSRDRGLELVTERFQQSRPVTGFEVDQAVRQVLIENGYGDAIRHRTGHGIDTEDHGSGVNLDSVEFPDHRRIIEGSCFSIEPGIYRRDWGLRTEINVYIHKGEAIVSGGRKQARLLSFS